MSLAAGSLRHRIEIHAIDSIQDSDTGNMEPSYPLFANAWANVRPATVREFTAAGAEYSKVSIVVTIRYIAGVQRSMRIRHGERLYNIEGVLPDPISGREYVTLPCSEIIE